jgi:7-cyano-7-deazaguanosine (preQ0) biosynthesis protein QueE
VSAPTASDRGARITARTRDLFVSEIFGPTFQGEGPSLGQRCSFLRLGGCNLACKWCDTPYTWDWTGRNGKRYDPRVELRRLSPNDVWLELSHRKTSMLVVSGGEPMLQQAALIHLLRRCREAAWRVEIETAGTIAPLRDLEALVDHFNVSLKLSNSGNALAARHRPDSVEALAATGKARWKFVATDPEDLDEAAVLVGRHRLQPVYIMPEGTTADAVLLATQRLAEPVLARGWNLTTRLHVLIHGDRRGV